MRRTISSKVDYFALDIKLLTNIVRRKLVIEANPPKFMANTVIKAYVRGLAVIRAKMPKKTGNTTCRADLPDNQ